MAAATGWVASREWFSGDDFAFLAQVQHSEPWSWSAVWLPIGERFWPFYRPLGMDSYFRLGFDAFGLAAPGFFAVTLAAHFARGWVAFRLARQLGCERATACVGGLLAVSGAGSLPTLFAGSIFHYVLASLAMGASVSWFLNGLRGRSRLAPALACLATAVALLCNESAVILPPLLFAVALLEAGAFGASASASACARAARRVAPHAALAGLYLALRFGALADVGERALYAPTFDLHVLPNALAQIEIASRGGLGLAALAALAGAGAVALRRAGPAARGLARGALLCLVWVVLGLLPFVALPISHPRFSIAIETPLALFVALALESLARGFAAAPRRALEAALLALPLLVFPWAPLLERGRHPAGELPRRLIAWISARAASLPEPSRIVVLYGVEGLADPAAGERFRFLAYNGLLASAVWPDGRVSVRFHDLNQRMPRAVARPEAIFVALLPDLTLEAASQALLDQELPRSLGDASRAAAGD